MNKSMGKIFIVSGSSGSGKTTLLKKLKLKREFRRTLVKLITVTTRPARQNEKNGRDYQFVKRDEFLKRLHSGEFIESQQIYGDFYATPKKDLLEVINGAQDALLCVDVRGALSLKHIFPKESVLIFILVPDIKSLRERLHLRSSESKGSLDKRMNFARKEMSYVKHYDYVIVNDVLKEALKKFSAIIIAERMRVKPRPLSNVRDE